MQSLAIESLHGKACTLIGIGWVDAGGQPHVVGVYHFDASCYVLCLDPVDPGRDHRELLGQVVIGDAILSSAQRGVDAGDTPREQVMEILEQGIKASSWVWHA